MTITEKRIVLITGGQRSGKSGYAQQRALALSDRPVYLATSRIWDEEHRQRIARHRADRGAAWTTVEEEKYLSRHDLTGRVVVVDCLTLWSTNFFFDNRGDVETTLAQLRAEFARLTEQTAYFLLVTNEIGSGGMSDNAIQRKFADLQGWLNQAVARAADEVIWMVAGIPVKIK